jgi:hypothetical protein
MRQVGLVLLIGAVVPVPARALEAPVSAVTVFSDRARVTRTAGVTLDGRQRVELPLLGDKVDAGTIRLDSADAEVQTVDLKWVTGDEAFPRDEARQVLDALAAVDAEVAQARRDRGIHGRYEVLGAVAPAVPSLDAPRAAPKLEAGGWGAVVGFARGWAERSQKQERALDERLRELGIKRAELAERARKLGGERRGAWRVNATVTGKGRAALQLSYLVAGARWYPSYDIQLDPASGKVQVAFAGLVSQETGEDWERAAITLSTAIPATTAAFPKLYTWKIGEKERFIPKPSPYVEPLPPVPPPVPRPAVGETVAQLRQALLASAANVPVTGAEQGQEKSRDIQGRNEGSVARVVPDVDYDRIPDNEPSPPPPAPSGAPAPAMAQAPRPTARYKRSMPMEEEVAGSVEVSSARSRSWQDISVVPHVATIGIAPPPGYQPPPIPADLPAALAGGYDLTYKAAAHETIRSGKGARRVALFGRSFPVSVERRVFPDLNAEAAFLVAEVKNPTGQPLPGGQARLFVGADPAGVAQLKTVAAGETFTLPLGLDRSVKPIRNVRVVTSQSGIISKDETSEYTVTIEVANPGRQSIRLRVVDQIPVTDDKDVEVKLLRASPAVSAQDPVKGKLEWQLAVPASSKATVSFVYSLKRPRGYHLHQ